ncbi:hypothetical protein [Bacillus sp. 1P06AnD]
MTHQTISDYVGNVATEGLMTVFMPILGILVLVWAGSKIVKASKSI